MRKVLLIELYRKYYFSYKPQVGVVWSNTPAGYASSAAGTYTVVIDLSSHLPLRLVTDPTAYLIIYILLLDDIPNELSHTSLAPSLH